MASNNDNLLEHLTKAEILHDIEKNCSHLYSCVVIKAVPFGTVMKGKGSVRQCFIGLYASASDFKVQPKSHILKTGHLRSK